MLGNADGVDIEKRINFGEKTVMGAVRRAKRRRNV
jgi:hypothetical protein